MKISRRIIPFLIHTLLLAVFWAAIFVIFVFALFLLRLLSLHPYLYL
jgi:hypothetical protein